MNPRRLFVASCIALVASAFSFVTRGDILPALGSTFDLNQASRGAIAGAAFLGMAISMFIGAPICDALGMKRMLGPRVPLSSGGSVLTVGSPYIVPAGSPRIRILRALGGDVPGGFGQRVRRDRHQPPDDDHLRQGKDAHAQRSPRLVARRAVDRGLPRVHRDQQSHGFARRRHRDDRRR